jgi:hypothetical protein
MSETGTPATTANAMPEAVPQGVADVLPGPVGDDRLRSLIQFGWATAELRGRYRQHITLVPQQVKERDRRKEHMLPLNFERSPYELLHQAEAEVQKLAATLALDICKLHFLADHQTGAATSVLAEVWSGAQQSLKEMPKAASDEQDRARRAEIFDSVANLFYSWDLAIQDVLATAPVREAAAYQLGRALAETYWSLDPAQPDKDVRSWSSTIGRDRRQAMQHMLVQLSPPVAAPAVLAVRDSLEAWGRIAAKPKQRSRAQAVETLHRQIRVWHMLLIEQVEPMSFVDSKALLHHARKSWRVLQAFWGQIVLALVGIGSASAAAALLTEASPNKVLGTVLVVLGLFGVTGAGAAARLKAMANDSMGKMRAALDRAMIAEAVTIDVSSVIGTEPESSVSKD